MLTGLPGGQAGKKPHNLSSVKLVDSGHPVGYMQLFINMIHMLADGFRTQKYLGGDLFIHQSL
jgi:hypothetical protein